MPFSLQRLNQLSFRNRAMADLADVVSGSVEHGRTDGHFGEDVGLGHPPAEDVGAVGRLSVRVLVMEKRTRTSGEQTFRALLGNART